MIAKKIFLSIWEAGWSQYSLSLYATSVNQSDDYFIASKKTPETHWLYQ